MSEPERLREALIDLERSRDRERELRLESETLLAGLRALTMSESIEAAFSELFEVFRSILSFQDAFVLTAREDGTLRAVSSSSAAFADSVWQPKGLFRRVIRGRPTAVFDVGQVEEWKSQPEGIRAAVRSALHVPLSSGKQATLLVCTHPERGRFGQRHVQLMRRFVPLASQALLALDLHMADLERHNTQLQTAAEVARAAASILELDELLQQVVDLVRDRFALYYVGLFLVEETGAPTRWAVLRAGTGEAGRQMMARGHQLEVGGDSMIGRCVSQGEACLVLDVESLSVDGAEIARFENPLLPDTRSELALPLISRDQTIGAMTIQSTEEAAFSEQDIAVLQTMADQIAVAVENAQLLRQMQAALTQADTLYTVSQALIASGGAQELLQAVAGPAFAGGANAASLLYVDNDERGRAEWIEMVARVQTTGAQNAPIGARYYLPEFPLARLLTASPDRPQMIADVDAPKGAVDEGTVQILGSTKVCALMIVPLTLSGRWVGIVVVTWLQPHEFSAQEEQLYGAVGFQLAMLVENRRLLERVQARVERERVVREIADQMERATDVEALMRITAEGLNKALGTSRAYVRMGTEAELVSGADMQERVW